MPTHIPAAGTVPWRRQDGELQVALVHRPRYDDWSWPKGKLDPDEEWPVAAVRETDEETGLVVRLGQPLPPVTYPLLDKTGAPATKEVRYWAAEVIGGHGRLLNEIDDLQWLDVTTAHGRLDYARDRDQLAAVVRADHEGMLATRPFVVVRHAKALPRSMWRTNDQLRPLEAPGFKRSAALGPVLAAYGIDRLVSSPSVRCVDTLAPYAGTSGLKVRLREGLSEEGFEADRRVAAEIVAKELARDRATALCSHGPVLPTILRTCAEHVADGLDEVREIVLDAAAHGMSKGEALVLHVATDGTDRIVAVERHLP